MAFFRPDSIKLNTENIIYQNIFTKLGCVDMLLGFDLHRCEDVPLKLIIDENVTVDGEPTHDSYDYSYQYIPKIKKMIRRNIKLIDILEESRGSLSQHALFSLYNMFEIKSINTSSGYGLSEMIKRLNRNKMFYKCTNKITHITTMISSEDYIVLKVTAPHILSSKKIIVERIKDFNSDSVNNLMMLLCFNIPMISDIIKLESDPLIHDNREHIKDYYDKYYMYSLQSVSSDFAQYLNKQII
jgi:hypothetical protein